MTDHAARIELTDYGRVARIVVDGKDIAGVVRRFSVDADPREGARLMLDLDLRQIVVDGDIQVEITTATRDALLTLGWQPPGEEIVHSSLSPD